MTTHTRLMTAEELLDMPDDGHRYELIRGELKKMAPPGQYHGRLALDVAAPLRAHVRVNNLGTVYAEFGFRLETNPDHVLAPDVSFISRERLEEIGETDGYWPGAPDLVVEVISPSDRYTEVEDKVENWLRAGVRMVIVVNPRNSTIRVHRSSSDIINLTGDDVIDGGDVVPGWVLPVREIFQ